MKIKKLEISMISKLLLLLLMVWMIKKEMQIGFLYSLWFKNNETIIKKAAIEFNDN